MVGQNYYFNCFVLEKIFYVIDWYVKEIVCLYGVFDQCLVDCVFVVGDDYSIVDMVIYLWIVLYQWQEQDFVDFLYLQCWFESICQCLVM